MKKITAMILVVVLALSCTCFAGTSFVSSFSDLLKYVDVDYNCKAYTISSSSYSSALFLLDDNIIIVYNAKETTGYACYNIDSYDMLRMFNAAVAYYAGDSVMIGLYIGESVSETFFMNDYSDVVDATLYMTDFLLDFAEYAAGYGNL